MRPNYRQNAQWTFRNRSQRRNRNDDNTTRVEVEIETIVGLSQGEERSLAPNLTPG